MPHFPLHDGGEGMSTIDFAGRDFVLLTGPEGGGWISAAETLSRPEVHQLSDDRALAGLRLTGGAALIVRPDGIIGWRSEEPAQDHAAALDSAMQQLTGR
jgi:hypothetical protein